MRIEQSTADVSIQGCNLVFSLPGLWDLLFGENSEISYRAFRAAIFRSTLNADLSRIGAVVDICRSTGKVDDSLYQLRLLDPAR